MDNSKSPPNCQYPPKQQELCIPISLLQDERFTPLEKIYLGYLRSQSDSFVPTGKHAAIQIGTTPGNIRDMNFRIKKTLDISAWEASRFLRGCQSLLTIKCQSPLTKNVSEGLQHNYSKTITKKLNKKKSPKRTKTIVPSDWQPSPRTLEILSSSPLNATKSDIDLELPLFIAYWRDRKIKMIDWDSTFRNRIKKLLENKPKYVYQSDDYVPRSVQPDPNYKSPF